MYRPPYPNRPNPQQKKAPAFDAGPVRLIENAGSLKAYVSVKIGQLVVHDFRVIEQAGQAPWVSVPQKTWNTPTGERRFSPLLELPREWKGPLAAAVLAAWEAASGLQEGGAA